MPGYYMDSGKENSRSIADHHANGGPMSFFESREGWWDSQTDLVRKCSFWSIFYRMGIPFTPLTLSRPDFRGADTSKPAPDRSNGPPTPRKGCNNADSCRHRQRLSHYFRRTGSGGVKGIPIFVHYVADETLRNMLYHHCNMGTVGPITPNALDREFVTSV